jgi:hypothetical protein
MACPEYREQLLCCLLYRVVSQFAATAGISDRIWDVRELLAALSHSYYTCYKIGGNRRCQSALDQLLLCLVWHQCYMG